MLQIQLLSVCSYGPVYNYGEFLKDKNVLFMYTTVQVRSEYGKFAYTEICMRNVYTLIW
jgi:hypothetical protein